MQEFPKQHTGWRLLWILITLCFFSENVVAQEGQYHKVTAPEVQGMMKNKDIVIINSLSKLEYELQHIPGSINIPINTIHKADVLPANKNTPLIFYCMASL